MSSPLPAGWLDTGITITQAVSCDLTWKPAGASGGEVIEVMGFRLGHDGAGAFHTGCAAGTLGADLGGYYDTYTAYIRGASESYDTRTVLDSVAGSCAGSYFTAKSTSCTWGPLRLGVTCDAAAVQYALFADVDTVVTLVLPGGRGSTTRPWEGVVEDVGLGVSINISAVLFGLNITGGVPTSWITSGYMGKLTNAAFSVTGSAGAPRAGAVSLVDIANVPNNPFLASSGFVNTGAGVAEWKGGGILVGGVDLYPPLACGYNLRHRDAAGNDVASQIDLDAYGQDTGLGGALLGTTTVTLSGVGVTTGTLTLPTSTWDPPYNGRLQANLNAVWCETQDPAPYLADRVLLIDCHKPKTPQTGGTWSPIAINPDSPKPVLLSANLCTGAGGVACGGAGGQTFTVTGAGTATRTLASRWRDWNDPLSPDYESDDGWRTTKHDFYASGATDDVWGWGLYAYLVLNITASVNTAATVTATVAVAGDTPGATLTFTRTWTLALTAGGHNYTLDLLFPDEGGPCYIERVDDLTFAGFANGTYTLNACSLATVRDGYLTVHDRGAFCYSQDGQLVFGQFGVDPASGAGPTGADPTTGAPTGARHDRDYVNGLFSFDGGAATSFGGAPSFAGTLSDLADDIARVEGLNGAYVAGTLAADLADAFGNTTGPSPLPCAWLKPNLPYTSAPAGASTALAAAPRVDQFWIVPATSGLFTLFVNARIGMLVEGIAVDNTGKRALTTPTLYLRRSWDGVARPGDSLFGSLPVDAGGYFLSAVPTGLMLNAGVRSLFWVYLSDV